MSNWWCKKCKALVETTRKAVGDDVFHRCVTCGGHVRWKIGEEPAVEPQEPRKGCLPAEALNGIIRRSIAARAMQGILARGVVPMPRDGEGGEEEWMDTVMNNVAKLSVQAADALLKQLQEN